MISLYKMVVMVVALYRRDIWPDLIYKMLVMVGALCRRDIEPDLGYKMVVAPL